MRKLTKKQRNKIYKDSLIILNEGSIVGSSYICVCIKSAIKKRCEELNITDYYELNLFKPVESGVYNHSGFFRGETHLYRHIEMKQIRELILMFCIEITE